MGTDTSNKVPAAWVDLRLPGRAHAQLKAWGARLGVSPEGMARMLLLMRMHELMDERVPEQVPAQSHDENGSASLALWRTKLQSIGLSSDELPAPIAVNGETRIYHVDSFAWGEGGVPQWHYAHVTGGGEIGVSKEANA